MFFKLSTDNAKVKIIQLVCFKI